MIWWWWWWDLGVNNHQLAPVMVGVGRGCRVAECHGSRGYIRVKKWLNVKNGWFYLIIWHYLSTIGDWKLIEIPTHHSAGSGQSLVQRKSQRESSSIKSSLHRTEPCMLFLHQHQHQFGTPLWPTKANQNQSRPLFNTKPVINLSVLVAGCLSVMPEYVIKTIFVTISTSISLDLLCDGLQVVAKDVHHHVEGVEGEPGGEEDDADRYQQHVCSTSPRQFSSKPNTRKG